ncbi:MAG: hypothetical protein WKF36_07795 [Candidatus Nitrosocosmicus sp.]
MKAQAMAQAMGTGDEGTGDEGTGDEGTGDEGTGDEGNAFLIDLNTADAFGWLEYSLLTSGQKRLSYKLHCNSTADLHHALTP